MERAAHWGPISGTPTCCWPSPGDFERRMGGREVNTEQWPAWESGWEPNAMAMSCGARMTCWYSWGPPELWSGRRVRRDTGMYADMSIYNGFLRQGNGLWGPVGPGGSVTQKDGDTRVGRGASMVRLQCPHFFCFFFRSDPGRLAKPSCQTVLERALEVRNQSSPVLRLSHSSARWRT